MSIFKEDPLQVIAKELTIIRELYELELAHRDTPIMRITERPSDDDTEVTYSSETPRKTLVDKLNEFLGKTDD